MAAGDGEAGTGRALGPDQLKALLLVLVVFGHTFSAGVPEDAGKWMLYGFHMPAFLFLSGWLLDAGRLNSRPLWELVEHYWARMLGPWLAVSLLYLGLHSPGSFTSVPVLLRDLVFSPEFHLWYIPALFGAVLLARLLTASRGGRVAFLLIAAGGFLLWRTPLSVLLPNVLERNLDGRYLGFLIWFALGLAARNGWMRLPARWAPLAMIVAGAVLYALAFELRGWFTPLGFLLLNLGLVSLVPAAVERLRRPLPLLGRSLGTIGRNSLWIYLLHPFVTELFRALELSVPVERITGAMLTVAILACAVQLSRARSALRRTVPAA